MRRNVVILAILAGPVVAGLGSWSISQKERFLATARITGEVGAGKGITNSMKATLTDGHRTHFAHVQWIDEYKPLFKGKDGSEEREFKDSWKFNVAAYRLAKLLDLTNMVPPSVARPVDGKPASVTWWIDNFLMDERARVSQQIKPPDIDRWNQQMDTIRVFDQLIYNMDRSQENLLICKDWSAWMIDHTRAFRKWKTLRNPAAITHCSPELLARLKALNRHDVERDLTPFVTNEEIDGLMARRDLIVDKLERESSGSVEIPAKSSPVPRRTITTRR
jgi:hypothetical protein